MGGDHGPSVTVPAAISSLENHPGLNLILVGNENKLRNTLEESGYSSSRLQIQHASQQVGMDESPVAALRFKKDSAMRVAINLVSSGDAQACVSAGNTGALMATARFVLKTLPGIDRPAIIAGLPTAQEGKDVRLLDLGANVDSNAEHLRQFALMGSILISSTEGIKNPRVGLLNIGEEDIKGNDLVKKASALLAETKSINYIGYIEANHIFTGDVDLVVCDGFVGNVMLKTCEGLAKLIATFVKQDAYRSWLSKLLAFPSKFVFKGLKKNLDPRSRNGAIFLGLNGVVVKSHGRADIKAFTHAISEAVLEAEKNIPEQIRQQLEVLLVKDDA